jgi:hypothetical protein
VTTHRLARSLSRVLSLLVVVGGVAGCEPPPPPPTAAGEAEILEAFEQKVSGIWVEAAGIVDRNLADDTQGSRHQRFILRLPSGHTLLLSHNIDLAPRIEGLGAGNRVSFRGKYEWNDRGGVVHWTHHDPQGELPGGWIEHDGRRYE